MAQTLCELRKKGGGNNNAVAFTFEFYNTSPSAINNYTYIAKQFLIDNGYSSIKVTVTGGSAYLFTNNSKGGTATSIAQVNAGSTQTFNVSQVTLAYLQIGANNQATLEFT